MSPATPSVSTSTNPCSSSTTPGSAAVSSIVSRSCASSRSSRSSARPRRNRRTTRADVTRRGSSSRRSCPGSIFPPTRSSPPTCSPPATASTAPVAGSSRRRARPNDGCDASPDRADAVVMAFAADRSVPPIRVAKMSGRTRRGRYPRRVGPPSWLPSGPPGTPADWNSYLGIHVTDPTADEVGRTYTPGEIAREEAKRTGRQR